jgi:FtsZ-interacting cell division protein ZipA
MKDIIIPISIIALIVLVVLSILLWMRKRKKEEYKLFKQIGEFPLDIDNSREVVFSGIDDSDETESLKYTGHRYDRHKIRSNPHVRRYQDHLT